MTSSIWAFCIYLAICSSALAGIAIEDRRDLPSMYRTSYENPFAFQTYLRENMAALRTAQFKVCLNDIIEENRRGEANAQGCKLRGDYEYILVCLNEDPRAAIFLWATSMQDAIFSNTPWTETEFGIIANFNEKSSLQLSKKQSPYLLDRASRLLLSSLPPSGPLLDCRMP